MRRWSLTSSPTKYHRFVHHAYVSIHVCELCHCCKQLIPLFSMQILFAPAAKDRDWKVVLQKESHSKREVVEDFDYVLGASRRSLNSITPSAVYSRC
jgi:hypothetical protein